MLDTLSFSKVTSFLTLESNNLCVFIYIGSDNSTIGDNKLWLHGRYQIKSSDADEISTKFLHKALVITSVCDGVSDTKNLVGDVMLFEDDESVIDDIHTGYFNYDLTDWLFMYEENSFYITVSLGKFISNTVIAKVNPVLTPKGT